MRAKGGTGSKPATVPAEGRDRAGYGRPRLLCLFQLPPPVHGATVMNEHVAQSALLRTYFAIQVLPLRFAESIEDIGRLRVRKVTHTLAAFVRLAGALLTFRPDAVYFTLTPVGGAFYRDLIFVALMKAFGVQRVYHLHGKGIAARLGSPWRRALYRWAFRGARVIHLSPLLVDDTAEVAAPGDVYVVPNGVAEDSPGARPARASAVPRVLYLSNMIEAKGPLLLLQALARLRARGLAFEATFAGARSEPGCLRRFEETVSSAGLADCVRYVGPAYGPAKDALLREHDVFVLPTSYAPEAFPLVLLEAMRSALPVVSTAEGAIPEIVDDGGTGFLVQGRDAAALEARLESLLTDGRLRQRMGMAGRERYLQRYTLGRFESRLAAVLQQCVPQKGRVSSGRTMSVGRRAHASGAR